MYRECKSGGGKEMTRLQRKTNNNNNETCHGHSICIAREVWEGTVEPHLTTNAIAQTKVQL